MIASAPLLLAAVAVAAPTVIPLEPLRGHPPTQESHHVQFDTTGTRLISWGEDGVRAWLAEEGRLLSFVSGRASEVAVGPRGRVAVAGYKDRAILIDVETGATIRSFATGWDWVEGLAVDFSARWLVITDDSDEHVLRYELDTGARLEVPEAVRGGTPRAVSPSGVLYWVDPQRRLHAWDPATGEAWSDGRRGLVARLDWGTGGGWLALTVWDWPSYQSHPWRQGWIRIRGPAGQQLELDQTGYDAAISPHGRLVAIARDERIHLIDPHTRAEVASLDAGAAISDVDWGADGMLVAATTAGPILRWRVIPGAGPR